MVNLIKIALNLFDLSVGVVTVSRDVTVSAVLFKDLLLLLLPFNSTLEHFKAYMLPTTGSETFIPGTDNETARQQVASNFRILASVYS